MIVPGNLISASTAAMQLALEGALDRDWNVAAGDLDWSCCRGLGIDWVPPPGLSELAILRLFPDAPPGEPSAVLLWCTGRAALDDRPRQSSWSWHSSVRE